MNPTLALAAITLALAASVLTVAVTETFRREIERGNARNHRLGRGLNTSPPKVHPPKEGAPIGGLVNQADSMGKRDPRDPLERAVNTHPRTRRYGKS